MLGKIAVGCDKQSSRSGRAVDVGGRGKDARRRRRAVVVERRNQKEKEREIEKIG